MRSFTESRAIKTNMNIRRKQMNILILQGSPRANGNTAWMAEEYRKVAESAGR